MRLSFVAVCAILPALAVAFEYPPSVPIEKRQAPGTPKYACHEDCGTVIALSKANGFCNNEEFTSRLSGCLDCALEQEIWEYYQSGVSKAAEACDLDATPKSPTTSQEGDATTTAVSPSSVAETTDPVETGRTNEVNTSTLSYSRLGPANECVNGLTRSIKAINSLANNRPEHHASDSARVHRGRSPRLFSGKMVMQLSRWVGWSWCKLGS